MRDTDAGRSRSRDPRHRAHGARRRGPRRGRRRPAVGDGPIAIVCGKGNNGGDGYVAARLLREAGRDVRVLAIAPVDELEGDAAANAERLPGEPPEAFAPAALEDAALAIDAILGTGSSGAPRGAAAEAIAALGEWGGPVVACDVASGVDASTGEVAAAAVHAVATATFAAAKPGLWINPGKAHAGAVRVIDIGIPPGAPVAPADVGVIHDASVLALVPRRRPGWTKFDSGHVLVAGGARGLSGAPCLAAEAAQRSRARLRDRVRAASAQTISRCAARGHDRAAAGPRRRPHRGRASTRSRARGARRRARRRAGVGKSDGAVGVRPAARARGGRAGVLDATGSTRTRATSARLAAAHRADRADAARGRARARCSASTAPTSGAPAAHARAAARGREAIVVLKGDDTLVRRAGRTVAVSPGASAALATAGTGDVLSGVIAAILARGVDPFAAACAGVRLHARAGVHAAGERGVDGVIARDVIEALPDAW
jgi:NAD(P)H-hydrate epimerase